MTKKILTILLAAMLAIPAIAQAPSSSDDFMITRNEVVKGIRYISAVPSENVCSKRINIQLKDGIIQKCEIIFGCPGNAAAVCKLLIGRTAEEAISKLEGIQCGNRGTSCPDQLARILKQALKQAE